MTVMERGYFGATVVGIRKNRPSILLENTKVRPKKKYIMPQKNALYYMRVWRILIQLECICSNQQPHGREQSGAAAGGHAGGLTLTKRPNIS